VSSVTATGLNMRLTQVKVLLLSTAGELVGTVIELGSENKPSFHQGITSINSIKSCTHVFLQNERHVED
jgi:hypothetical protein